MGQFDNINSVQGVFGALGEMTKNLGGVADQLSKSMKPLNEGFEVKKKYKFVYNGKNAELVMFKNHSLGLSIEGVTEEDIKKMVESLDDRHTVANP